MSLDPKQKTADLLTICNKAGKTIKGFDSVCEAVKNGKAFCVLTAKDASSKTLKEISFISSRYGVTVISTELEKEELGRLCGKQTAVAAVADKGFADGFCRIYGK
jgi:ribosomal protein L7Ae-like RNA K-turn-binding protein